MAYDEGLATRVRRLLATRRDVVEKAMFGGLAFLVRGHMTVGLVKDDLIVRVAPGDVEALLDDPHPRPMDFTGRPMRGWLFIEPAGVETASGLRMWVGRALAHTDTKPEGTAGRARPPRRTTRPTAGARRTERD